MLNIFNNAYYAPKGFGGVCFCGDGGIIKIIDEGKEESGVHDRCYADTN